MAQLLSQLCPRAGFREAGGPGKTVLAEPARYVHLGPVATAHVPQCDGVVPNLPGLARAAAGQGALAFVPDSDGVIRRLPMVVRVGDRLLPTLAA